MATKEPVTVGGWYENTDGSWTEYTWRNGELVELRTAAEPETSEQRSERWAREDRASRAR
jgi:hypothetical protein